jgi:hypothetical protein
VATTEVQRHTGRNTTDVEDVPSAEWGWSYVDHRWVQIGGLLGIVFLLCLLRGNHVGHIEDAFLIAFAALIAVGLVRDWWLRRRGWIR